MQTTKTIYSNFAFLDGFRLSPTSMPYFRKSIAAKFPSSDLFHNHDTESGKVLYRFPKVQYKFVNDTPFVAYFSPQDDGDFLQDIKDINTLQIGNQKIPEFDTDFQKCEQILGHSEMEIYEYRFLTPWIALNQQNNKKYIALKTQEERNKLLERTLVSHILKFCSAMDYTVASRITVELEISGSQLVEGSHNKLRGFNGSFYTNFILPNLIGLGKSCSLGFGTIEKVSVSLR